MNTNVGFIYFILLEVISNSSPTNKNDNSRQQFSPSVKVNVNSAVYVNITVGVAKGQ